MLTRWTDFKKFNAFENLNYQKQDFKLINHWINNRCVNGKYLNQELLDYYKKNGKNIPWIGLSKQPMLSLDFIRKYKSKLNWVLISYWCHNLTEEFIEEFSDKICWWSISENQVLSESFIEKHADKIDWINITKGQELTEEFIEKHINKIDMLWVAMKQQISEDFIKRHENTIDWGKVSGYQKMSLKFILDNLRKIDNFALGYNNKISEETKDYLKKIGVI